MRIFKLLARRRGAPGAGAGVNATKVADLNADGKLFKKLVGSEISKTDIPKTGVPAAAPVPGTLRMTGNDIVTVTQKTGAGTVGAGTDIFTRYVAYSNDSDGALADTPQVKAYDHNVAANITTGMGVHPVGHALAGKPYFNVPITGFTLTPETVRFMQFPTSVEVNNGVLTGASKNDWTTEFGDKDIAVANVTTTGQVDANHYVVTLDLDYTGETFPTISVNERAVQVLAKPSDHIVAYFEDTEGLVEGVNEAFYSNKIVVQEIGASARRTAAQDTTSDAVTALAFGTTLSSHQMCLHWV